MLTVPQDVELLAERLASAQGISVDEAVKRAIENSAHAAGIFPAGRPRRRATIEDMLATGAAIAAMPLLDSRSPQEIMDDLNAP